MNGDTVVIEAYAYEPEELAEETGCVLSTTKKEITLNDVPTYADYEDIPKDTIEEAKKYIQNDYKEYYNSEWEENNKMKSIKYVGYYFAKCKDPYFDKNEDEFYSYDYVSKNALYLLFEIKIDKNGETVTYYYTGGYEEIMKNADGKVELDISEFTYKMYDGVGVTLGFFSGPQGFSKKETFMEKANKKFGEKYVIEEHIK